MRALIDADMLVYELAFGAEDRETKEVYSFESIIPRLEQKLADIVDAVKADSYTLFLTGKGNFRFDIAKTKPYKGNRQQPKPFHYENVRLYMESLGAIVVEGMEADDALAIAQSRYKHYKLSDIGIHTVICTRDKDLRQVAGWHYGWEHGLQPEFALQWVDEIGSIELLEKTSASGKVTKTLKGTGLKFFYAQCILGDTTDNIPGLKGKGDVFAYELLKDCTTEEEMFNAVREAYQDDELLLEQGQLLWMVRELNEDGSPAMWRFPNG